MTPRAFNIRLWFALCALGAIGLIGAVAGYGLTAYVQESLLAREGQLSQNYVESIAWVNGVSIFHDRKPGDPVDPKLLDLVEHLQMIPGAERINVHSANHQILWSNEPQIDGRTFASNPEVDRAFRGEVITELTSLEGDSKEEHVALGNAGSVIESYIPIRSDRGAGPVVGVVEFYRLPLALEKTLADGRRAIWGGAALASLILFGALYWVVQRGANIIESQQEWLGRLEVSAAIGQMASAVAHSLRNPMAAIRSSAELWRLTAPEAKETTAEVIAEVDRMDRYVRDLLDYAKADAPRLQPVDLLRTARAILDKQARATQRQNIVVEVDSRLGGEVRALAEPMMLEQALTSLIGNAVEAMPDGGRLHVEIVAGRRGRLELRVTDTGPGIAPELIDRIAQSQVTTKAHGLGLGLVLARGVIERFDGRLSFRSRKQGGVEAVVELKAA